MLFRRLVLVCGLVISQTVFAWGASGHAMLCEIAWQNLSAEVQGKIIPLYREKGYSSFAESCNWADHIKSDSKYDHLKPLHYVNLKQGATTYSVADTRCPKRACVTQAIVKYRDRLTNQQSPSAEALLLLSHFVGDIHQPMHVSYAKDWGGHKLALRIPGDDQTRNLHWLWDVWILGLGNSNNWQPLANKLQLAITEQNQATWRANLNPHNWASESFAIAVEIYKSYQQKQPLNVSYIERYQPLAYQRIQQGGVRLAGLLEQAFAD